MVYRSSILREETAAEALVLHCSDHRFQASFHEFLTAGLGLRRYALVAVPGGGHLLAAASFLPKLAKTAWQSLSFLVERGRPRRVVLIAHDDCLFFKERLQFLPPSGTPRVKQEASLRRARQALQETFPELPVDLYFAAPAADGPSGALHFQKVD